MYTGYEFPVIIMVAEVKGFWNVPYVRFILSHTYRFSLASLYSESKPRLILIADINTLKHGSCTPKVLHIVGHSIMVLVMAYDVKRSKSGFYSRSYFIATTV